MAATMYKSDLKYDSVQCGRYLLTFQMNLLFLSCSMSVQSLRFSEILINFPDIRRNGIFRLYSGFEPLAVLIEPELCLSVTTPAYLTTLQFLTNQVRTFVQ